MATNQSNSVIGALARLFWMFAGPAVLFLLAYTITQKKEEGWFAPASIAFLIVLVGMIIARWLDSDNAYGDPTTPAEIRTFTAGAIFVGFILWIIANFLGNHWLAA
jgi:hypothetical protein